MTDQKLETFIGNLLRIGVLSAAAVVAFGAVFYLFKNAMTPVAFHVFVPSGDHLRTVGGIFRSAFHGDSQGIMQLGLLLLIATPVARVVLAAVGFFVERDRLYVAVSLIVLAILIFSMAHAT
ncbi:MAG TPA: DUF1634 domain-containing protein [Terriglobales bacterium]|nr:DUF1634 domain-containing protein [Terriglobales bacterium]